MQPRVSVVIPAYGRQRHLHYALQSLASEAHLIHEVVVVDDASPEPITITPPPALASRTNLVRLSQNGGSAAARQVGIDISVGDLVAFLDSDDAWLPGKLAAQLPFFSIGDDMLAVATGWQMVDLDRGTASTRMPRPAKDPIDFASGCWFCPGSTVIVTRGALARCGPLDTRLRRLEDLEWFLRFAFAGGRLAVAEISGALIRRAAKSNRAAIETAAATISAGIAVHPGASAAIRRRLAAWLDVERALAAWTEGHALAALGLLLRSQVRVPRASVQLQPWWRISAPLLPEDEVKARLGLD
jgi:glycosyltransferase involved in cell wall biosynthesis